MTPEELSEAIALALEETISSGQLTLVEGAELPAVRVERPKSREHGDWATNVALQLAKKVGKNLARQQLFWQRRLALSPVLHP